MFCSKCGNKVSDSSTFCDYCGAPLRQRAEVPVAGGGTVVSPGKRKAAKIFWAIAAGLAVLCMVFPLFPQVSFNDGSVKNVFEIFAHVMDSERGFFGNTMNGAAPFAVMSFLGFLFSMCLCIPWGILSLLRKRSAGVLGLITSILFLTVSNPWYFMLEYSRTSSWGFNGSLTVVPLLMISLASDALVLSIIQLIFRNAIGERATIEQKTRKTKGTPILYFVSGGVAALSVLAFIIPVFLHREDAERFYRRENINAFEFIGRSFGGDFGGSGAAAAILMIVCILLLVAWCVLSFLRIHLAGLAGIIANVGVIVLPAFSSGMVKGVSIGDAYIFCVFLFIAGLVLSIIQLAKRRHL